MQFTELLFTVHSIHGVHFKLSLLFFALFFAIVMLIPIAIGRSNSSIAERDASYLSMTKATI